MVNLCPLLHYLQVSLHQIDPITGTSGESGVLAAANLTLGPKDKSSKIIYLNPHYRS